MKDQIERELFELNLRGLDDEFNLSSKYESKSSNTLNSLNIAIAIWAAITSLSIDALPKMSIIFWIYLFLSLIFIVLVVATWFYVLRSQRHNKRFSMEYGEQLNKEFRSNYGEKFYAHYADLIAKQVEPFSALNQKRFEDSKRSSLIGYFAVGLSALLCILMIATKIYGSLIQVKPAEIVQKVDSTQRIQSDSLSLIKDSFPCQNCNSGNIINPQININIQEGGDIKNDKRKFRKQPAKDCPDSADSTAANR